MENYKNILVPYDFKEMAEIALAQSYNLAKLADLDIMLLYVNDPSLSKNFNETDLNELEVIMKDKAAKATTESGIKVDYKIVDGKIADKIIEVSNEIQAKYIVISISNVYEVDIEKREIDSITTKVIKESSVPILTFNNINNYNGCRSILLPLDFTKQTRQKVSVAIDIAKKFKSKIKVVTAIWEKDSSEITKFLRIQSAQVRKFILDKGVDCTAEIIESPKGFKTLVPSLLDYAYKEGDVDLVMIMAQQEVGWVKLFIGSLANEMIRTSNIPVMLIQPKETGENLAR